MGMQYPGPPGQQAYYQPQAPAPIPGVDVKVSYAGRMGCVMVLGVPALLLALYALVAPLVMALGESSSSPPAVTACKPALSGTVTCTGRTTKAGLSYVWNVSKADTYSIHVQPPSTSTESMELTMTERDGGMLEYDIGSDASKGLNVAHALSAGQYRIKVEELSPTAAGQPFTLTISRRGGGADDEASPKPSGDSGMIAIPFGLLGLLFCVVIPLVFANEKKRIPRRLDPNGVTMRNGVVLPWNEYRGVRPVIEVRQRRGSSASRVEVGMELQFARGNAVIRYRPIQNMAEIAPILASLKQGRYPWA